MDLWRSAQLRKYSIILYFSYFVNNFVYYGLSLNVGDLNGDLFLNYFLAGLVEIPSYLVIAVAVNYFGRKQLITFYVTVAGLSCLGCVFFLTPEQTTIRVTLAMLGKFCVTSSFTLCYVYASEIYPTVIRQTGLALCTVAGRIGSILAPFVKELVISLQLTS